MAFPRVEAGGRALGVKTCLLFLLGPFRSTLQVVRTMACEYALCSLFVPGDRQIILGTKVRGGFLARRRGGVGGAHPLTRSPAHLLLSRFGLRMASCRSSSWPLEASWRCWTPTTGPSGPSAWRPTRLPFRPSFTLPSIFLPFCNVSPFCFAFYFPFSDVCFHPSFLVFLLIFELFFSVFCLLF